MGDPCLEGGLVHLSFPIAYSAATAPVPQLPPFCPPRAHRCALKMPLQNGDRGVFLKPCSTHWPQKRPTSICSLSHAGGTRGLGQSDATNISRNATSFGGDTQGGRWLTVLAQVRCKNKCYLYWRAKGGCVTVALGGWEELREKYIREKKYFRKKIYS